MSIVVTKIEKQTVGHIPAMVCYGYYSKYIVNIGYSPDRW